MKKYYLHNGTEQDGPFYISQLKKKGITRETEVWYEGLSDWTKADQIEELKELFEQSPPQIPPIKQQETEQTDQIDTKPKKSFLGKNLIKLGLIAIGILGVFAFFFMFTTNSPKSDPSNYQKPKMTIEETENSNPKQFLSVEGEYNESFWGNKFKVKGIITNRASKADYKDIIIQIKYYSKTKSVIGSEEYTIYEVFPPNQEKAFKLDAEKYKDVASIKLNIIGAKPN